MWLAVVVVVLVVVVTAAIIVAPLFAGVFGFTVFALLFGLADPAVSSRG